MKSFGNLLIFTIVVALCGHSAALPLEGDVGPVDGGVINDVQPAVGRLCWKTCLVNIKLYHHRQYYNICYNNISFLYGQL